MARTAFDCFEQRSDMSWICTRSTTISGPSGDVTIRQGQVFAPKSVFAGHADFAAFLLRHSVERAGPEAR